MKKSALLLLAFICVLSLFACNQSKTNNDTKPDVSNNTTENITTQSPNIVDHLTEIDGQRYLILPISKSNVRWENLYDFYIKDIDFELLKNAEKTMTDQVSELTVEKRSSFYLRVVEGELYLCAEVIVDLEPPSEDESGCGIDHDHVFFKERITK